MGRSLLLARHAEAGNADNNVDFDRPLTAIGERDARHMGRWLAEQSKQVDAIIASEALRAKTTAEILGEELNAGHSLKLHPELYEASVRTMLQVINEVSSAVNTVMIVGHNPTVTYLADYLTSAPLNNMVPGSVIEIDFDLSWNEVSQNTGEFKGYYSPASIDE